MPKKEINFNAGDVIYRQGEPCRYVYVILEGRVEMYYEINGNVRVLAKKSADDILGATSVLEGMYDTSARAENAVILEQTSADDYIAQLQKSGELAPSPSSSSKKANAFTQDDEFDFDFSDSFESDDDFSDKASSGVKKRPSSSLFSGSKSFFDDQDEDEEDPPKSSHKALVKIERKITPVIVKPTVLPAEIKRSPLKEWLIEGRTAELAFGPVVLLASILDDSENASRDALFGILRQVPNLQVKVVDSIIEDPNPQRAQMQMRSWLQQHQADIGLYARFDNTGRILGFHVVRALIQNEKKNPTFFAGTRFFLPVDMTPDHSTLLKVFTVSAIAPTRLEHEQLLRFFLPVLLNEASAFGATPMAGLNAEEQSVNLACFANALSLANAIKPLDTFHLKSAEVYQKSLSLMPKHAPEYVFINRQMGLIHQILGEKKDDVEVLKKAEETFTKALGPLLPERQPEAFGDLKIRIGNVRQRIASFTGLGEDFALAMGAYRDALSVLKPSFHTEKWADAMNGLAKTMQVFGAQSPKTTLLKKSIELYEKELSLLDPDQFILQTATASNNLASALFLLNEKEPNPAFLKRAVQVFSDALSLYDQIGAHKMAHITTNNLRRAEQVLSETHTDSEQDKDWLNNLLDETDPKKTPSEGGEEPLVFEKIAIFEELDEDE